MQTVGRFVILLSVITTYGTGAVMGQELICSTPYATPDSLTNQGVLSDYSDAPGFLEIRLRLHILRDSGGSGGRDSANVDSLLARTTEDLFSAGISLDVVETAYLDNTTWFNDPIANAGTIFANTDNADHLDAILGPETGSAMCRASSIPGTAFIVTGSVLGTSALSHGIGHCFGLHHTHQDDFGVELPDSSNGDSAGDLVHDTAADPGLSGYVDGSGDLTAQFYLDYPNHEPDPTNIMAASPMSAWDGFTPEQGARMRAALKEIEPLAAVVLAPATLYTDRSSETNMAHQYTGRPDAGYCIDFNHDDNKDLLLSGITETAWRATSYSQNGVPFFVNSTSSAFANGVGPNVGGELGLIIADYDNDSWEDFYVPNRDRMHSLYKNINGVFTEVAESAGLKFAIPEWRRPFGGSWADYDGDGDVDLLVNVASSHTASRPSRQVLLRNDVAPGNPAARTFVDVTASTGFTTKGDIGSMLWADFDGDNDNDVVLVLGYGSQNNDPCYMENINGSFADVTSTKLDDLDTWNQPGCRAAVADVNNDGDLDIFHAHNEGAGYFENSTGNLTYGDNRSAFRLPHPIVSGLDVLDFDLNGDIDMVFNESTWGPRILRNRVANDGYFWQILDNAGMDYMRPTNTFVAANFHRESDGYTDFFLGRESDTRFFYKADDAPNDSTGNWVGIRLVSPCGTNNYRGIGARVVLIRLGPNIFQAQVVDGGRGDEQHDLDLVFGIGDHAGGLAAYVYWPNGTTTTHVLGYGAYNQYYELHDAEPPTVIDNTVTFEAVYDFGSLQLDWKFTWETQTAPGDESLDRVILDTAGLSQSCMPSRSVLAAYDTDVTVSQPAQTASGTWLHTLVWEDVDCAWPCTIPYEAESGLGTYTSTSDEHKIKIFNCLN